MTGRQKKTTKRLAWLLTLFLVISAILPQPMQAAVSSQTGQVVMEGIRLSKTSLVMKTGGRRRHSRHYSKGWNLYCHLPGTCDRTGADAGKYGIYAEQFRKQPL